MRATRDRATGFYTVNSLGAKQALTPEGFLICADVPIARTGEMVYHPDEIYSGDEEPLPVGPDGTITVTRDADDVFRPEHVASYVGKPVVDDHPERDTNITPDNWRELAVGSVMNPRRGLGEYADLLIADLVITDAAAIAAVRAGKREVSCGYNAEYEVISPGRVRQLDMIGNHVALVQSGRCGPRCAISDHKHSRKGDDMQTRDGIKEGLTVAQKIRRWYDRVAAAVAAKDEAAIEKLEDEMPDELKSKEKEEKKEKASDAEPGATENGTHIHLHTSAGGTSKDDDPLPGAAGEHSTEQEARFAKIEAALAKIATFIGMADDPDAARATETELAAEAPAGTADKARTAKDSAYMEDSFQQTASMAEILAPGIRIPTFDRALNPKKTLDSLCAFRRSALDLAYNQAETRALVEEVNGRPLVLDGMSCAEVRALFRGAAAAVKAANSGRASGRRSVGDDWQPGGPGTGPRPMTLAQLNEIHAKHYGPKH